MDVSHAHLDELSELELASTFADFNGPQLACPFINILEQVVVNGLEMFEIEISCGRSLNPTLNDKQAFRSIQILSICNIEALHKHPGVWNQIWAIAHRCGFKLLGVTKAKM